MSGHPWPAWRYSSRTCTLEMASRSLPLSRVRPLVTPEKEITAAKSESESEADTMRSAALWTCPRSEALRCRSSNRRTRKRCDGADGDRRLADATVSFGGGEIADSTWGASG